MGGGRGVHVWELMLDSLFKVIYLFIYLWLLWVFVAVCKFSLVVASEGYSLMWCAGFSLRWLPVEKHRL